MDRGSNGLGASEGASAPRKKYRLSQGAEGGAVRKKRQLVSVEYRWIVTIGGSGFVRGVNDDGTIVTENSVDAWRIIDRDLADRVAYQVAIKWSNVRMRRLKISVYRNGPEVSTQATNERYLALPMGGTNE